VNRPDPRNPAGGWQTTPGQPIPRAARRPAANGLLLVMVLLVWFSPLSLIAWLLGQAVILLQRRWHWWRFTLAALVQPRGSSADMPGCGRLALRSVERAGGAHARGDQLLRRAGHTVLEHPDRPWLVAS
jgi:hypothetical protein